MTKTEAKIVESLKANKSYLGIGKRAFNTVERMQAEGKLQGAYISYECFNGNGPEFRSQWNSPKSLTCYEVSVSIS